MADVLKTQELTTYAAVCSCGYGQAGDRGIDPGAVNPDQHAAARRQAVLDGQKWDGKTTITVPVGAKPTCPNCQGEHDPEAPAPAASAPASAERVAELERQLAELREQVSGHSPEDSPFNAT
jgi:hypothetical protein